MILQNKTGQRNLTANDLVEIWGPHQLHTYKKKVTTIEIFPRPGPNVPYVYFLGEIKTEVGSMK